MSIFHDGAIEISCVDVLNSFVIFFDGELEDVASRAAISHHLDSCLPCRAEAAHEESIHTMMRDLLSRSCCESAPQDLHDSIAESLAGMRRGATEIVTEFRMTEISIQVDEFGSIEHREITIESTQIESIHPERTQSENIDGELDR